MAGDTETKEIFEKLKNAILTYNTEEAKQAAQTIISSGIDPLRALKEVVGEATNILHERFESGEIYLPHLIMAGDAMNAASETIESAMPKDAMAAKKVVVIGTVEADLHSVGKNIVAMMLRLDGFVVHDLGVDVKSSMFISRAKETNADIIALSSLLTTTRPYQREVIEELETVGLRKRFKVMVGGGPITAEWAKQIGADGYGADAVEGLEVARKLVGLSK